MVRRLPVLQSTSPADAEAEQRPRSHWIAIAAGLTLSFWVPLAMLGLALGKRAAAAILGAPDPAAVADAAAHATPGARLAVSFALVAPALLSFVAAGLAAGALVGRFGGRSGPREAAVGAAAGALAAWGLAAAGGALGSWPVAITTAFVLVAVGGLSGAWGGQLGRGRRPSL